MLLIEIAEQYAESALLVDRRIKELEAANADGTRYTDSSTLNKLKQVRKELRHAERACRFYYERGIGWMKNSGPTGLQNTYQDVLMSLQRYKEENGEDNQEVLLRLKRKLPLALSKLTEVQRTYLLEHYSEGLTVTEIAARHGVDKSVASRTISRAKANLRSYLEFCLW